MKTNFRYLGIRTCSTFAICALAVVAGSRAEDPSPKENVKVASVDREALRSVSELGDPWILRNSDGQEIEAHLVSAHGETIKIQRVDDEKEFDVPISMFDSSTEHRIRLWIEEDPIAVDYKLDIRAQRNLVDSNDFKSSGRSYKTSKWAYRVTIANETRNDLTQAQVEYRIIYDDNVEFVRTVAAPGKGEKQQDGQAVDLPNMSFNDEIEFTTPPVQTQTYEYEPTRGDREFAKDEIKGIWIRVIRHGDVIAEYKSNEAAMGRLTWDNEGEVEIKVTNRFRESFGKE